MIGEWKKENGKSISSKNHFFRFPFSMFLSPFTQQNYDTKLLKNRL